MKDLKKLLSLLLCLPFLFLACEKDKDKKQDDLPSLTHEFIFIESALSDNYTADIIPVSIEIENDQLYIGDTDMEIHIYANDYTHLGVLETKGHIPINASTVRFKRQNGFFIYNQHYNYMMFYNEECHRENELNDLTNLNNELISGIDRDLFDNVFLIYNHNTIHKYNKGLEGPNATVTTIGQYFDHGNYPFEIMSICVDNNQNVYVAVDVDDENDEGMDAILKFDNDLNFMKHIGGNWTFNGPCGIAFDRANNMYVANRWQHVVKVFNTNMEMVAKSGEIDNPGTENGQLNEPIGIRINNNRVYITEKGNHRISVFTAYN